MSDSRRICYATHPLVDASRLPPRWPDHVRWLWIEEPSGAVSSSPRIAWSRLFGGSLPRGPRAWIAESSSRDGCILLDARGRVYQAGSPYSCRLGILPGSAADACPRLVISGGQPGAARGGLRAAESWGVPIGGWAPRDFRTEDGQIPADLRAHLRENRGWQYNERSTLNSIDGDGTLVVSLGERPTEEGHQTLAEAESRAKPHLHQSVPPIIRWSLAWEQAITRVRSWLWKNQIGVLNVTGSHESQEPGIEAAAWRLIARVLDEDKAIHEIRDPADNTAKSEPPSHDT